MERLLCELLFEKGSRRHKLEKEGFEWRIQQIDVPSGTQTKDEEEKIEIRRNMAVPSRGCLILCGEMAWGSSECGSDASNSQFKENNTSAAM